jgi:hypothetical protein
MSGLDLKDESYLGTSPHWEGEGGDLLAFFTQD